MRQWIAGVLAAFVAGQLLAAAPAALPTIPAVQAWTGGAGEGGVVTLAWEQRSDAPLWLLTNAKNEWLAQGRPGAPGPQTATVDALLWRPGHPLTVTEYWPDGRRGAVTAVVRSPMTVFLPVAAGTPPGGVSLTPRSGYGMLDGQ